MAEVNDEERHTSVMLNTLIIFSGVVKLNVGEIPMLHKTVCKKTNPKLSRQLNIGVYVCVCVSVFMPKLTARTLSN